MLEHVDRLQRPVVPRKVEVPVYIAPVLPISRKPPHALVDRAFLDPKVRVRPQLHIQGIVGLSYFVRSISESHLHHMQHDVRTRLHVVSKIMESFSSPLPPVWVRIHRNDVEQLTLGIFHEFTMNVCMLETHGISSRPPAPRRASLISKSAARFAPQQPQIQPSTRRPPSFPLARRAQFPVSSPALTKNRVRAHTCRAAGSPRAPG